MKWKEQKQIEENEIRKQTRCYKTGIIRTQEITLKNIVAEI